MVPPPPAWVQSLKPSGPQGSELLKQERDRSDVSVDKLSEFIRTKDVLERQKKILAVLQSEKVFDKTHNYSLGRVDRIQVSLGRAKRLQQLTEKHGWTEEEFLMANDLMSEPTPYGLHASMFLVLFATRRL